MIRQMNIEQNKELLGSEMSYSPKKQLKGTKWGFEKGVDQTGWHSSYKWDHHLRKQFKDEELNIFHLSSWSFPHPLCDPEQIREQRRN